MNEELEEIIENEEPELPEEPIEEPEEPIEEEPIDEEPIEEPVAPIAPSNLKATVNDDVVGVTLSWEAEEASNVSFKVYLQDVFTGGMSHNNTIQLSEMVAGETYKANVTAIDTETLLESEFSNAVYFEIKGLAGSDDPANWIGVRLDNITVVYEK